MVSRESLRAWVPKSTERQHNSAKLVVSFVDGAAGDALAMDNSSVI